jgi:hypothetical protein
MAASNANISGDSVRALADLVLSDDEGHGVRLGDLWLGQPVALVWLRHYG